MKIVTVRRISQVFFFFLFAWFCFVTVFGAEFDQLRGWPVNLFLQLDPLVAILKSIWFVIAVLNAFPIRTAIPRIGASAGRLPENQVERSLGVPDSLLGMSL